MVAWFRLGWQTLSNHIYNNDKCEVLHICMYYLKKIKKETKKQNKNKKEQELNNDGNLLASAIEEHLTHLASAVIKPFWHMDKTDICNHWCCLL